MSHFGAEFIRSFNRVRQVASTAQERASHVRKRANISSFKLESVVESSV